MDNKNVRARARLCRKGDMWCGMRHVPHAPTRPRCEIHNFHLIVLSRAEVRGRWADIFGFTGTAAATWFSYSGMYSVIILVNKTIVHTPNVQPNTPYLLVSDSFRYLTQRGVEDARYE